MKGKTRNFNNQWLIQAYRNQTTAIFNHRRILKSVEKWDKHSIIAEQLKYAIKTLLITNETIAKIQYLFNDPRSVKIEVE